MKSQQISTSRNQSVDVIRGIAMLMVVLGHTISVSTTGYEQTFVFQVIWTLQMPLFMLISGYVTRYSRPIDSGKSFLVYFKKRSLAYLFPLIVWTFGVRGLLLGTPSFLNIKYMLWHMDIGYWFLASLWTLCICYGVVDCLCNKIHILRKTKTAVIIGHLTGCLATMVILAGIGFTLGLNFFCIKLTLYYFPFYLAGYIYGQLQKDLPATPRVQTIINVVSAVCLASWIYLITRIDFYSGSDTGSFIAMRFIASLLGCAAVISLLSRCSWRGWLYQAGVHSIQIYLLHYLFLNTIRMDILPKLASMTGLVLVAINYALTIAAVTLAIILLGRNHLLSKILFFKDASKLYIA